MAIKFHNGIKAINESEKPVATAWELSFEYLELDSKVKKLIEILSDHENLLINYNPYHNHFHLAEVIWSSAFLAKKESFPTKYFESMIVLLLAATFHDAEHPGRANRQPFETEEKSAVFFRSWWKNNSLFVENILSLDAESIELAVNELIMFTDFTKGHARVTIDYNLNRDTEYFGLRMCRLKKILNEADILLNCLPLTGFRKTDLILKESIRNVTEEQKWQLLLGFLKENGHQFFISEASKELKLDQLVKKFMNFLILNQDSMKDSEKLQQEIEAKFKAF